jgi:hypothetical protein
VGRESQRGERSLSEREIGKGEKKKEKRQPDSQIRSPTTTKMANI